MTDTNTQMSARPKRYNKRLKLTQQSESEDYDSILSEGTSTSTGICNIKTRVDLTAEENPLNDQSANEELHVHHDQHLQSQLISDQGEQINDIYGAKTGEEQITMEKLLLEVLYDHEKEGTTEIEEEYDFQEDNEPEVDYGEHDENKVGEEDKSTTADGKIYPGHNMPIRVSMLLILVYCITHSISGSQLQDLLTLISLHCLESHRGLKSLFHFKQYFADLNSPMKKHYFCSYCLTCITSEMVKCPNKKCMKDLSGLTSKTKSYFIEVPMEDQLRNFFRRENFVKAIKHRFSRRKKHANNIEDIYDGNIYRKYSKHGGPLSESNWQNLSFTLNTDGVSIFKSSKFSVWPVYLMINELPFKMRRRSENMLFCGLWFGDTKPLMATFCKPMYESLRKLEEDGITVEVGETEVKCRGFLLCSTADLPAKSLLLNMNQFNGEYSCIYCLDKGSTFRTSKGGSVHIFPFNKTNPFGKPRSQQSCISSAREAINTGKPTDGIKGPSFLMCLKAYDFVKSSGIDYMHGALLGITKLLINLWFSGTHSKEDFSLTQYTDIIDCRLLEIKPPSFITRVPRAISSHLKYWKASELRAWLFLYSLPLLQEFMTDTYFIHYAAFVQAMFILCEKSISHELLQKSEQLLVYFVMTFCDLYGERYQTLNLHSLLHLPECVRNLGPIWVYSCFSFETANGDITKYFHGTQHIDTQILSTVNIIQMLPIMISEIPPEFKHTIQQLHPSRAFKSTAIHPQFFGKSIHKMISDIESSSLLMILKQEPPNLLFFKRLLFRGEMYHSMDYERVTKRNSFTVKYYCPCRKKIAFGQIRFFAVHEGSCLKNLAFINPFELVGPLENLKNADDNTIGILAPHVQRCHNSNRYEVIEIENLLSVCADIHLINSNEHYVVENPNNCETD